MKRQTIKSIIFSAALLGITVLFWYFLSRAFTGLTTNILISLGMCLIIWTAVVGIYCMIVNRDIIAWFTFFLSLVSFLLFFDFNINYLIGILILFLVLIIVRSKIIKEVFNRIKISPRKSLRRILSIMLTFVFLFIAFAYYLAPVVSTNSFEMPRLWFKPFEKTITTLFGKTAPLLDIKGITIDDFVTMNILIQQGRETKIFSTVLQEIPRGEIKNFSTDELLKLIKKDPKTQKLFIQELEKQRRGIDPILLEKKRVEMGEFFGIILEGGDSPTDVIYKSVNQRIDQLMGPYKKYVPLIISIILFLFLQGLLVIIIPLVLALAEILFQIFVWTKFVKIQKETKEVEIISL